MFHVVQQDLPEPISNHAVTKKQPHDMLGLLYRGKMTTKLVGGAPPWQDRLACSGHEGHYNG